MCCIVKDENDYIEEWIRYHLAIGIEHFFIYDNGSKTDIKTTLKELGLLKYASVTNFPGRNQHVKAYNHCLKNYGKTSQWIAFIDVDEFIVPKNADSYSLPSLLRQYENFAGLGVNWLIFGSGGLLKKPVSQLKTFVLRSEPDFLPNKHIKSIVQPQYVESALKSHCFRYLKEMFCVNENFEPILDSFSENSVEKIQLNHYYCRSREEFKEKISRGISDTKRERKWEEFHYHDSQSNKIRDETIINILERINSDQCVN